MSSALHISISNDAWQNHLLSSLKLLRNHGCLCNTTLISKDGESCRAHAVILAASSPVLCGLLSGHGPEFMLPLQQVADKNVMQHILDFIYEGQITLPIKLLMDVQSAADKLCINQLSDVCSAILKEMGLGQKQDAKVNTAPVIPPPSKSAAITTDPCARNPNNCVLKVPTVTPNSAHTKSKATTESHAVKLASHVTSTSSEDQAIDLSIVKSEKPEIRCSTPLSSHSDANSVNLSTFQESQSSPISLVQPKSRVHDLHNVTSSKPEEAEMVPKMHNSRLYDSVDGYDSLEESPLQIVTDNNNSKVADESQKHQEPTNLSSNLVINLGSNASGNLDSNQGLAPAPLDEDDELIEEMVAEQLLQSRMQRSLGKQPKGMKRFHCRICDSRFTRLDNLRVHIRSIHTGKKPFKCNICSKTFTRAFTLKYHKMSHDGVKPWTCQDCGRGFTRKDYHQEHIRNQICKRNNKSLSSAALNMSKPSSRTSSPLPDHDGYQCQICDSFFSSQDSLENHMENCMNDTKWEAMQAIQANSQLQQPNPEQMTQIDAESMNQEPMNLGGHMSDDQDDSECICEICNTRFLDRDSLFVHQLEHKRQEDCMKIEMIAPDAPDGSPCKISRQDEQNLESIKKVMNEMSSRSLLPRKDSPFFKEAKKRQLPSSLRELLCEEEEQISKDVADDLSTNISSDLSNISTNVSTNVSNISTSISTSISTIVSNVINTRPLSNSNSILDLRKNSLGSDENENVTKDVTKDLSLKNHNSVVHQPLKKQRLSDNFNCSQENLSSLISLTKQPFGFINCFNNETDENNSMNLLNEMKVDSEGGGCYPPRKRNKQEQPYECDICQARFTRGDNMRVHRRRHFNSGKIFTCSECGQAFTRSSSLKTHLAAAHKISSPIPQV